MSEGEGSGGAPKPWGERLRVLGREVTRETFVGICVALVLALLGAMWAFVSCSGGSGQPEPVLEGPGAVGQRNTGQESESAGWFDSLGHREAVEFRDELTPWKDHASFNCLVGTPSYGDERAFFDAKDGSTAVVGGFQTDLDVAPGDRLLLRIYIHNCADPVVNRAAVPRGDAVDARVRIVAPSEPSQHLQLYAYILAGNTKPEWIADGLDLRSESEILLRFLPGTGRLYGNRFPLDGLSISDEGFVVSNVPEPHGPGSTIGSDGLDGIVRADGFESDLILVLEAEIVQG